MISGRRAPKYLGALWMERTSCDEIRDGVSASVIRIDLNERFRPEAAAVVNGVNLRSNIACENVGEGRGKLPVFVY